MIFKIASFTVKYKLTVICTLFFVLMLCGYLIKPDTGFSELENRYLASRPKLSLKGLADGSFEESFETYTAEQLPFRNAFIRLKSLIERAELKKENNGIILGEKGQLFEKLLACNRNLKRNEDIVCSFIEKAGRRIYFGLIPNSFEIQKDRLPRGVPNVSEKEAIDEFCLRLSSLNNCEIVDIYETLQQSRGESIYYNTDHHWTTRGAALAYAKLCGALGLEPVNIAGLEKSSVEGFYGTYYAKYKGLGIKPDRIDYYETPLLSYVNLSEGEQHDGLYDMAKADTYDKYGIFMYGNPGEALIELAEGHTGKSLILLKDSYSNCLIPFLTYNYDRIRIVDLRYFGGSLAELLDDDKEADVLLLYNFMHFSEDSNFYKLVR